MIPEGYPGAGNFILFNNNHSLNSSAVLEIVPPVNESGFYTIDYDNPFDHQIIIGFMKMIFIQIHSQVRIE